MLSTKLETRLAPPNARGCRVWLGHVDEWGYGRARFDGRIIRTHRVAWELAHGPIPEGMRVLHRCDNPPCCNPDHLFLGTDRDNAADRDAKGRGRLNRGNPKLTPDQVRDIRRRHAAGESQTALARSFPVRQTTISEIIHRRLWPDLD